MIRELSKISKVISSSFKIRTMSKSFLPLAVKEPSASIEILSVII